MDSGIILCTGRATTAGAGVGANGDSALLASSDNATPGDAGLNTYISGTTRNACALEFDFKPLGDTVKFDYIFSSEEYPQFSCSQYNDVFAFFISGPGITGTKNIALVPNTNIPVAINSVVDTDRVNVAGGTVRCTNMGPGAPFAQYYAGKKIGGTHDGFTTVLRAQQDVVPCMVYHLKLIIADVGDAFYDSGVWLRARSLSSNVSNIASSGLGSETPYAIRGCYDGKFTFTRQDALATPLVVRYQIAGTAVNGVDYTQIADSVVIPAYGTQATLNIDALPAAVPSGMKTVKLYLLSFNCDPSAPPVIADSALLEIYDELKFNILTPDTTVCEKETIWLRAEGDDVYNYTWSGGLGIQAPNDISTQAKPPQTVTYTLTARYPACPDASKDITVTVEPLPIVDAGKDTTICQWDTLRLHADVGPKWYQGYTFEWTPTINLNTATDSDVIFKANEKTIFSITAKTSVGCTGSDTVEVDIYPGNYASAPQDKGVCPGDSVEVSITGGTTYNWTPSFYLSSTTEGTIRTAPGGPVKYTVYVADANGCKDTVEVPITTYPAAILYLGNDVYLRPGERYQMDATGNCVNFQWFPNVGLSALNIPNPVAYPEANTRYFVVGVNAEGCSVTDTIDVYRKETEIDIPNAFSPGSLNHELKIVMRGIATLKYFRIFNRWGEKVFETTDINSGWDGRLNGENQPMGVYIYEAEAVTIDGRPFKKQGNVTLIR